MSDSTPAGQAEPSAPGSSGAPPAAAPPGAGSNPPAPVKPVDSPVASQGETPADRSDAATLPGRKPGVLSQWFTLHDQAPAWEVVVLGLFCIALCLGVWWFLTRGPGEERIVGPLVLPSPGETFGQLPELIFGGGRGAYSEEGEAPSRSWGELWTDAWSEEALPRNLYVSLRRLLLGFGLAALVGVPLGIACGCYSRVHAFFLPLSIFGRNIPLAALVGLTFSLFGIGELQKVMFIFLACVAFVLSDTAQAIRSVGSQYIDTAFTLGARSWQVIFKVLIPLAMPTVFNSLRLLFGLAFGYIMLAETIKFGNEAGGLGNIINMSMRRNLRENVLLVLLIIPVVALAIDRLLYWIQRELFPHEFGGRGLLNRCVRATLHLMEDLRHTLFRPARSA